MLTLRRRPSGDSSAYIDIVYGDENVTLQLLSILKNEQASLWRIQSSDWGVERYHPRTIALTFNQQLPVNDWLKIYGSNVEDTEASIHLSAPKLALINRRDR